MTLDEAGMELARILAEGHVPGDLVVAYDKVLADLERSYRAGHTSKVAVEAVAAKVVETADAASKRIAWVKCHEGATWGAA